jgi:hypothetical protein
MQFGVEIRKGAFRRPRGSVKCSQLQLEDGSYMRLRVEVNQSKMILSLSTAKWIASLEEQAFEKEQGRIPPRNSKTVPESVLICPFNIWTMRCVVASQRIESAAERVIKGNDVSTERASRGNERTACGHGGLPLRRVLRDDGAQVREAGPKQRRVGASHLRVRRVRSQSNVQRGRRQQLIGD